MNGNNKATLWRRLRRWGPQWIAALVLLWLLHGFPGLLRYHARRIAPDWRRLLSEGAYRIPPSRTFELKGTHRAIAFIQGNIPPEAPLFYIGRMSRGIRLRYYTFPRASHWHYVYRRPDVWTGVAALEEARPAYVVIDWAHEMRKIPIPEPWRKIHDQAGIVIYEVHDYVAE